MSGFLKIIGILNAAIWFGAGLFFVVGILPGIFSTDMHQLFHETAFAYYAGAVALILFKRFFILQYVCGTVALIHLVAEKLYVSRPVPKLGLGLVLFLLGSGLIGGLWFQPHMEALRSVMYTGASVALREKAAASFALWHHASEAASLFILAGLLIHLVRVTRTGEPGRYGTFYQIPG